MTAERNRTYFISDLHIGAGYITDRITHERKLVKWLRRIAPSARAIYLLGDILDYWYEYRTVVPRGYIRFFGVLAELSDQGVEIVWLKGNHDIWIFDYLPAEIGLTVADGVIERTIDGHRFVMEHGDGVGEHRRSYRIMRRLFRNRFAQWLYAAIHPRWTVGFAHRWSKHSRLHAECPTPPKVLAEDDPLIRFTRSFTESHGHVDFFIFGHRHTVVDQETDTGARVIVIGDGFNLMTYGEWDGSQFSLRYIKNNEIVAD